VLNCILNKIPHKNKRIFSALPVINNRLGILHSCIIRNLIIELQLFKISNETEIWKIDWRGEERTDKREVP
jgi:hypothetical protein